MDFNRLSSNEKLAVYASVATIVGAVIAAFLSGLAWFGLLAGIAMLVVIFLPQLSAGTSLPGSKGSIMFLVGLIAGAASVLALATTMPNLGTYMNLWPLQTLFLLIAVAGGLVLAWTGWQEFQAGGGSWQIGSEGTSTTPPRTTAGGVGSTGAGPTDAGSANAGSSNMGSEGGAMTDRDDERTRNP